MTKQFKRMVLRDIIPLSLSTMPLLAYSSIICIFYTSSSHYNKPPRPSEYQLDQSSEAFYLAVVPLLKSKAVKTSNRCQFSMRHDIYRFLFKNKGTQARDLKSSMFALKDLGRQHLPPYWWYVLDANGQGKAIDFPLMMKAHLGKSPKYFIAQ